MPEIRDEVRTVSEDASPQMPEPGRHSGPRRIPVRVGEQDVRWLERVTRSLRGRDYAAGGGDCRETVLAELAWGRELLRLAATAAVRDRLLAAVADLHNLAGWTAFDIGWAEDALIHYRAALELAGQCGQHELEANVRYRLGRLQLLQLAPTAALTEFARSQEAADRAGSVHAAAITSANQAWAEAMRNQRATAIRLLGRAHDEFVHADRSTVPSWAAFFGTTDLSAMIGTVYTELAVRTDPRCAGHAVAALTSAVENYTDSMRRSRALCQAMLALDHLLAGDLDQAAHVADAALDDADRLASSRVAERMRPLHMHLRRHRYRHNQKATGLLRRMERFLSSAS
jgi:hypothetical protein